MKKIRRFARIPQAGDVGKMNRDIWRSPEFSFRPIKAATEFVHTLPFLIPERIQKLQPAIFTMLFSSQAIDLEQEIMKAYERAEYCDRPVQKLIPGALHAVLQEAIFEIFKKSKKSRDPYAIYLKGGRKSYSEQARPRRRPNKSFRDERAERLASRYNILFPKVAEFRGFIQSYKNKQDESDLKKAVEKRFTQRWVPHVTQGQALQLLPNMPRDEQATTTLGGLDWTNRELTAAILECEEKEKNIRPALRAGTILKYYVPRGRKKLRSR
jgi:hypothetical protein